MTKHTTITKTKPITNDTVLSFVIGLARDPTRSSQNHAFLYWALPNNLFSVSPPKIWVNFSTTRISGRVLIFEPYYWATDAEFKIPNNKFKLQIPLLGYYLDAKSNLVHITRTQPQKAVDRGRLD